MEIKKEPEETSEAEKQEESHEEEDRKLPAWMLTLDETTTQNEEGPKSPPPSRDEKDSDKTETVTSTSKNERIACKYGEHCYRRNPTHKQEFSHPGDDDYIPVPNEEEDGTQQDGNDNRPECQYGTSCYRQNPQHKRDFKHTQPPSTDGPVTKKPRKTAKTRRPSEADYESGGENEYDLGDPFIDDSEADEENIEDEKDEDYVPDVDDEIDQDLLKDDQWKASADDAPEVLELLKDARDYLRNKKL